MATGALFADKCFFSSSEAADAYFASALPAFSAGSISYYSSYIKDGGVWKIARYSIDSNGVSVPQGQAIAPVPAFASCDPMEAFYDGQLIGWGLALVMIGAWCIFMMRRGL